MYQLSSRIVMSFVHSIIFTTLSYIHVISHLFIAQSCVLTWIGAKPSETGGERAVLDSE